MADKAWKRAEREVAEYIGGERVPITGRQRGDVPDVEHEWLAVEVKRTGQWPKKWEEAMMQALASAVKARAYGKEKLPIVIVRPHRREVSRCIVMMELKDFMDWFGGQPLDAVSENKGKISIA